MASLLALPRQGMLCFRTFLRPPNHARRRLPLVCVSVRLPFFCHCSSALAPATLHKLEAAFKAPVLEVSTGHTVAWFSLCTVALVHNSGRRTCLACSSCCLLKSHHVPCAGVCHDRGLTPDDLQPAAQAWRPPAGHCGQGAGLGAGELAAGAAAGPEAQAADTRERRRVL